MDTSDVDPNADKTQERYTSHLFNKAAERPAGPSGTVVRVPSNKSIWPPALLFDAVYASAVVHNFGFVATDIVEKWWDAFPGGPTKAMPTNDKDRHDQTYADDSEENTNRQKPARQRRYKRRGIHGALDYLDIVMIHRCMVIGPENVRAYLEECNEMAAARERNMVDEKVNSWRESLVPVTANDTDYDSSHDINESGVV